MTCSQDPADLRPSVTKGSVSVWYNLSMRNQAVREEKPFPGFDAWHQRHRPHGLRGGSPRCRADAAGVGRAAFPPSCTGNSTRSEWCRAVGMGTLQARRVGLHRLIVAGFRRSHSPDRRNADLAASGSRRDPPLAGAKAAQVPRQADAHLVHTLRRHEMAIMSARSPGLAAMKARSRSIGVQRLSRDGFSNSFGIVTFARAVFTSRK